MANGVKNLEQAFNDVINNAVSVSNDVVRNVGQKVQTDMYNKANKTLEEYYADYSPKRYKRTYSLRRSIKPYTKTISSGEFLELEVGIEYDSRRLDDMYESNSYYHQAGETWISRYDNSFDYDAIDNGVPESSWILDNFLEGIHPRTKVDKMTSDTGKAFRTYTYNPYKGSVKPLQLMEEFVNKEIEPQVQSYVQEELWNAVVKYF